jgi:NADP-dependent 3-hydroxyisobutyrate dehydrogenase-like protein
VRQGDGVGLIGGDARIAEAAAPILDALFPRRFYIGKIGDGGRAKLAINLILGLNRLALAEGLVFAERLGLDEATFLDVAPSSAAASQVMDTKGPKMVARDFAPEGRVRQTLKDARLMIERAQDRAGIATSRRSRRGAGGLSAPRRRRTGQQRCYRRNPPPPSLTDISPVSEFSYLCGSSLGSSARR